MKKLAMKLLAAAATTATLAVVVAAPAEAYVTTGCHWANSNVGYYYNGLNTSGFNNSVHDGANAWDPTDVEVIGASSAALHAYTSNDGASGYDGWSTWSCGSNRLTSSATARLNTYSTTVYPTEKKKAVWVHEFGHTLGLEHSANGNIMYTCSRCIYDNFAGRNTPQADDRNGVNSLY